MAVKYLLPCLECHAKRQVDGSQSGLTLACECGNELHVPTFRGLEKLERVEVAAAAASMRWGAREGMVLVGVLVAAIGGGLGLWGYFTPDVTTDDFLAEKFEDYRPLDQLDNSSPRDVLAMWLALRHQGIGAYDKQTATDFHRENHIKEIWTWVAFSIAGLGVLMVPAAFVLFSPRR